MIFERVSGICLRLMIFSLLFCVLFAGGCTKKSNKRAITKLPQRQGILGLYRGIITQKDKDSSTVTVKLVEKGTNFTDLPLFKVKRYLNDQFTFEDFANAPSLALIPLNGEVEFLCGEEINLPETVQVFWDKPASSGKIVPGY